MNQTSISSYPRQNAPHLKSRFSLKYTALMILLFLIPGMTYAQKGINAYSKGIDLRTAKKYEKSIKYFDKAIQKNPKNYKYYTARASARRVVGQYSKAYSDATRGIELNEKCINGYYEQGVILSIRKQYDEAIKKFEKCVELDETYASAYNGLGAVYYLQEDYDEALKQYQKALELDQESNANQFNVGQLMVMTKEYQASLPYLNKAIGYLPNDQKSFFERGLALYKLGEMELAELDFRFALLCNDKEDPWEKTKDDEAYYFKGMANFGMQKIEEGCIDLQYAIDLGHEKSKEAFKLIYPCADVLTKAAQKEDQVLEKNGESNVNSSIEGELTVFPNPVVQYANVKIPTSNEGNSTECSLVITDINAKEIKLIKNIGQSVVLDRTGLEAGAYFVKIKSSNGNILYSKRIVVQ